MLILILSVFLLAVILTYENCFLTSLLVGIFAERATNALFTVITARMAVCKRDRFFSFFLIWTSLPLLRRGWGVDRMMAEWMVPPKTIKTFGRCIIVWWAFLLTSLSWIPRDGAFGDWVHWGHVDVAKTGGSREIIIEIVEQSCYGDLSEKQVCEW